MSICDTSATPQVTQAARCGLHRFLCGILPRGRARADHIDDAVHAFTLILPSHAGLLVCLDDFARPFSPAHRAATAASRLWTASGEDVHRAVRESSRRSLSDAIDEMSDSTQTPNAANPDCNPELQNEESLADVLGWLSPMAAMRIRAELGQELPLSTGSNPEDHGLMPEHVCQGLVDAVPLPQRGQRP